MKKFLPVFLLSFVFVACQKETRQPTEQPLAAQTITNVNYAASSDTAQRMDVYLPAGRNTTDTKVLIMIHGGGWISGDKVDMNPYVEVIKSRLPEYAVFNLNYRLGAFPATNPFPAQENDVRAAVNYITSKAQDYRFNTDKAVILGASAGGHLALLQAYKNPSPKFKAVVDFFGPTDMVGIYNAYASTPISQLAIQALLSGTPATNASLYQSSSPLNFVSAQSQPTLILHGTADPVVPYAQSTALKTKLETAGVSVKMVTYAGAGHGDWNTATFDDAFNQVVSFLKEKNP